MRVIKTIRSHFSIKTYNPRFVSKPWVDTLIKSYVFQGFVYLVGVVFGIWLVKLTVLNTLLSVCLLLITILPVLVLFFSKKEAALLEMLVYIYSKLFGVIFVAKLLMYTYNHNFFGVLILFFIFLFFSFSYTYDRQSMTAKIKWQGIATIDHAVNAHLAEYPFIYNYERCRFITHQLGLFAGLSISFVEPSFIPICSFLSFYSIYSSLISLLYFYYVFLFRNTRPGAGGAIRNTIERLAQQLFVGVTAVSLSSYFVTAPVPAAPIIIDYRPTFNINIGSSETPGTSTPEYPTDYSLAKDDLTSKSENAAKTGVLKNFPPFKESSPSNEVVVDKDSKFGARGLPKSTPAETTIFKRFMANAAEANRAKYNHPDPGKKF